MRLIPLLVLLTSLVACSSSGGGAEEAPPADTSERSRPAEPAQSEDGVPLVRAPAPSAPREASAYPQAVRDATCKVAMGNVRADQSDEEARLLQAFSEGVDGVLQVRASGAAAKIELTLKLSNETIGPGDPGADNRAVSGKVRGVATATWSGADGNQVQASLELVQPFTTMGRSSMREHLAKTLGEGLSDALLQKLAAR
ncbi:MAG TPA: hypothetical protein DEA08_29880 [Planctomycetes bacterium]|nr:hypothetical protein [Planctomycetota bacterium]